MTWICLLKIIRTSSPAIQMPFGPRTQVLLSWVWDTEPLGSVKWVFFISFRVAQAVVSSVCEARAFLNCQGGLIGVFREKMGFYLELSLRTLRLLGSWHVLRSHTSQAVNSQYWNGVCPPQPEMWSQLNPVMNSAVLDFRCVPRVQCRKRPPWLSSARVRTPVSSSRPRSVTCQLAVTGWTGPECFCFTKWSVLSRSLSQD